MQFIWSQMSFLENKTMDSQELFHSCKKGDLERIT